MGALFPEPLYYYYYYCKNNWFLNSSVSLKSGFDFPSIFLTCGDGDMDWVYWVQPLAIEVWILLCLLANANDQMLRSIHSGMCPIAVDFVIILPLHVHLPVDHNVFRNFDCFFHWCWCPREVPIDFLSEIPSWLSWLHSYSSIHIFLNWRENDSWNSQDFRNSPVFLHSVFRAGAGERDGGTGWEL